MPRCVVCKSLLPPGFLSETLDGLAKKCIFCKLGKDTLDYVDKSGRDARTSKSEVVKEYQELLNELSDSNSVKEIIDTVRERESQVGGVAGNGDTCQT